MRQIDFVLQKRNLTRLNCALGVKFHAWLMKQVSTEFSNKMHSPEVIRPYSLFTRIQQSSILLRLSLLHETAAPLLEAAKAAKIFEISGLDGGIAVLDYIEKPAVTIEQLRSTPAPKEFQIVFAAPATYKHNGQPSNIYSLPALLNTVAAKLREFENRDIPNEEILRLCDLVTYPRYELRSAEYSIELGVTRPGVEGELLLRPGGAMGERDDLALLLRYAAYAGIGAKTALGMGGILLSEM
jgi:CRISPR/Cas system endoribonuclease Cas6 (RAMP superfamily)